MIFNETIETMSPEEMKALQTERLKKTVATVYERVPFYKQLFDELEVKPEHIRSLDDIQKLPFTTKKDLHANYPFGLFSASMNEIVRVHASSGTSGKPTVVGYTRHDLDVWAEVTARAIVAAGGRPGNVLHNAYGYGLFTGGMGLHYGSEKLGMVTVPVSGGNTERQMLLIEDFKPQVICGTPSYILNIAETMESRGKDPRDTSLQYGIFGAEPWSEELRRTLEERFAIKAVDIYGLSEVMGPGVSIECHEVQDGLHIAEDHFYVEVIDPETLEHVPEGEDGELVFTSLTKEGFPILRYRTGDLASITRGKCACGRTTVKMSRVKGRIDDMLIIRGVNVFPSEIENHLLTVEEIEPFYQIVLSKKGPLDQVELKVELKELFFQQIGQSLTSDAVIALQRKVGRIIQSKCLVSMRISINTPKSLPRSEGKAVRIVDLRNTAAM